MKMTSSQHQFFLQKHPQMQALNIMGKHWGCLLPLGRRRLLREHCSAIMLCAVWNTDKNHSLKIPSGSRSDGAGKRHTLSAQKASGKTAEHEDIAGVY